MFKCVLVIGLVVIFLVSGSSGNVFINVQVLGKLGILNFFPCGFRQALVPLKSAQAWMLKRLLILARSLDLKEKSLILACSCSGF